MSEFANHPIKAILIDVDNTLLDFNKCAEFSMCQTFEHFGMKFDHSMFSHFLDINNYLWGEIEQGRLTKDELYKIRWDMIFKRIEEVSGVNPAAATGDTDVGIAYTGTADNDTADIISGAQFEKIFLEYLASGSEPVDGAHRLLEYLSEKYIVCIASNAPYEQQVKRLQSADMLHYIDKLFISEQIGYAKPSKKFFDACMAQLPGISPKETVIIGDSLTADIGGGIEYGLTTCWFNHSRLSPEHSAQLNRFDKFGQTALQADYIVNSLDEIHRRIL